MNAPSADRKRWALVAGIALVVVVAGLLIGRKWFAPDPAPKVNTGEPIVAQGPTAQGAGSMGKARFDNHCAQCHGERGDGQGLASRFLYPKPRDFREGKFRLVTTSNRLPSNEDLMQVIARGMPGSAMIPFGHLAETDRQSLVAYVRQLTRAGIEDRLRQAAERSGDEIEPTELARNVDRLAQVGEPLKLTSEIPTGVEAVARGRALYMTSCATCHGETGKGDGAKEQRDDDGTPTQPRDFTRGIFKGGRDSRQLFSRIAIGMPGTPMPGSPNLKPDEIGAMVAFIQSLSDPAAQSKVEHKRTTIVAQRLSQKLPEAPDSVDWSRVKPVPMIVSPLWWREFSDPDLQVQACHDGETLAVRLTWCDPTRNVDVLRTEDFEDMAALQLSKSQPEPFVGMGAIDRAIDLWLWRPRGQGEAVAANPSLDDYPFDSPLYGQVSKSQKLPDFITARAAGNPNAAADRGKASSLTAGGFGSTTVRPRTSQLVAAHGHYADGRWSVVLRRPLAVKADDGVSLKQGESCSIALALWDGAARDRNGQKLISIWHDLKLE